MRHQLGHRESCKHRPAGHHGQLRGQGFDPADTVEAGGQLTETEGKTGQPRLLPVDGCDPGIRDNFDLSGQRPKIQRAQPRNSPGLAFEDPAGGRLPPGIEQGRVDALGQPGALGDAVVGVVADLGGQLEIEVVGVDSDVGQLAPEVGFEGAQLDRWAVEKRPGGGYQRHAIKPVGLGGCGCSGCHPKILYRGSVRGAAVHFGCRAM